MKYHRALATFSIPFALIIVGITFFLMQEKDSSPSVPLTPGTMEISSSAFEHNDPIPSQHTCDADNVSPPLTIAEVPAEAKSLALIVDDPDAPAKVWAHWVVWNIDPQTAEIAEDSAPGTEGTTDFDRTGWSGPCPPSGTHRYFFKLYALDIELDLDETATKAELEAAMEGHIIDEAELIGTYAHS